MSAKQTRRRDLPAVALTLLIVVATLGAGPSGQKAKGARKPGTEGREAREILGAFRDLSESARKNVHESKQGKTKAPKLPDRPARTVTPPTLNAETLDALIDKELAAAKAPTAHRTNDEEFARRVYLDVVGRLPSPEEVRAFCLDKARDKRARLIDRLLASPESARNWARYWRDVIRFRASNENRNQFRQDLLEDWLARQLEENRPWDEIATDLITAAGRNDENGAVNFAMAEMAQPVEMAGAVSRIFLGVQIQCAECHDHKTDPWKREQFHEFAAFFAGLKTRRAGDKDQKPPVFEVVAQGKPRYAMPDLKDPQKTIPIEPKFFLASKHEPIPRGLSSEQRRALVASYITGQDNPWFARAYVNRIWTALMGEGFYNPVDDLGPTRTPASPEIIDALASEWQKGGYDVRWLFRTILNTRAYQRESRASGSTTGRVPFAANGSSRLRSDQLFESLAEVFDLPPAPRDLPMGKNTNKNKEKKGPNPNFLRGAIDNRFGVDPSIPREDVLGTIPQALFLMNSGPVNNLVRARNGSVLGRILATSRDERAALNALYLRVLARHPTPKEEQVAGRYIHSVGNRSEAFEDIFWCLINSAEFSSRR